MTRCLAEGESVLFGRGTARRSRPQMIMAIRCWARDSQGVDALADLLVPSGTQEIVGPCPNVTGRHVFLPRP